MFFYCIMYSISIKYYSFQHIHFVNINFFLSCFFFKMWARAASTYWDLLLSERWSAAGTSGWSKLILCFFKLRTAVASTTRDRMLSEK
mmetsp:Transcript_30132/g.84182  ORF Transcript_30132/g.84182 Transcript_30132/m.84182 type:complete len:88 (+) Transcript_30132:4915-5178(+)